MSSKSSPLKYTDDTDRTFGVAGMAIALVLWDGEPMLASINIDNPAGSSIQFSPAFGFAGNPRITASLAWRELLKQYELSTAMILGNAMCRSYVGLSRPVTSATTAALRAIIRDEGREVCQLDDDEIEMVYNKTYRYLDRVFSHAGVAHVARDFAGRLASRRSMTASEVFEALSALSRL